MSFASMSIRVLPATVPFFSFDVLEQTCSENVTVGQRVFVDIEAAPAKKGLFGFGKAVRDVSNSVCLCRFCYGLLKEQIESHFSHTCLGYLAQKAPVRPEGIVRWVGELPGKIDKMVGLETDQPGSNLVISCFSVLLYI